MKIAFDAKRAFLNYSGLGNYSRTAISLLAHYFPENEYLLYTPKTGYSKPDFPPSNTTILTPERFFDKKFSSLWRTAFQSNDIKNQHPDIFHGLSNELPFNIQKADVKSVVTIHDLIFLRFPELYKPVDRFIYKKKFATAAKVADKVIAISEQTKEDIINFLHIDESKIEVVYQSSNPVFSEDVGGNILQKVKEKYGLPSEFILYVGTIEERKNLLNLLMALHEGNIKIPLVVVGNPKKKYTEKVYSYIRSHLMEDIIFIQNIPLSDLPAIYRLANLFVYPSSFEGFGIPVLEAIQSGIPVIAGKGSCLEETGGSETIYIDPFNGEEFSESIRKVLEDSLLREKMIKEGLKFSENFKPEKTVKSLYKVYESIT